MQRNKLVKARLISNALGSRLLATIRFKSSFQDLFLPTSLHVKSYQFFNPNYLLLNFEEFTGEKKIKIVEQYIRKHINIEDINS